MSRDDVEPWWRVPPHVALRWAGRVCAVGGLAAAAVIWWARAGEPVASAIPFDRTRAQEAQLERIGGKFAVMASHFDDWLGSLWYGRSLAVSIAVIALALAALAFWIARYAEVDAGAAARLRAKAEAGRRRPPPVG